MDNQVDIDFYNKLMEAQAKAEEKKKFNNMMAGVFDSLGNRSSFGHYFLGQRPQNVNAGQAFRDQQVKNPVEEELKKRAFMAKARQDRMAQESSDANSALSQSQRDMYQKLLPGADLSGLSANQLKEVMPMIHSRMQKMDERGYQDKVRASNQQFQRSMQDDRLGAQRAKDRAEKENQRLEDQKGRMVPGIGLALTAADAKDLKSGSEMKSKLDRQISELIDLRKKYGAEVLNRDAVERGKQLSKDILLGYKNMAKLGVLSKADEAIIDAIIPADPLGFSSGQLLGQDPILSRLVKFRDDVGQDYENSLKLRLEDGGGASQMMAQERIKRKMKDLPGGGDPNEGLSKKAHASEGDVFVEIKGQIFKKTDDGFYERQ